ncbi:hypothetical protein BY996DRAFT_6431306 [Phakopsora pachyrhizi]|nr:hypothetical protein BY996DRAFT_6431306 [Phakopsora pachyrhizi]
MLGASRILIFGRNKQSGSRVILRLRDALAAYLSSDIKQQFEFLQDYLFSIKAIAEAANEIKQKVGSNGFYYLVMTQGGMPNGLYDENSDGLAKLFVVQEQNSKLYKFMISVLSPGYDFSELDIDNLSLKNLHLTNPWRASFIIRFLFPLQQLGLSLAPILNKTIANSPSSYSDIPIFFVANPNSKKFDGYFFNERLKNIEPSNNAKDPTMQQTIFQKFKSLLE